MQKKNLPCSSFSYNKYPSLPPHLSYWFFYNDMHKKVISLSLHFQWWLIKYSSDNQFHIWRKCLGTDIGHKWHRHHPAVCTGAISLYMQALNTKYVLCLHCLLVSLSIACTTSSSMSLRSYCTEGFILLWYFLQWGKVNITAEHWYRTSRAFQIQNSVFKNVHQLIQKRWTIEASPF